MEISNDKGTCRCCLLVGSCKDLWSEYSWMGIREVYGDMLIECFVISVQPESLQNNEQICDGCIKRLRDAHYFKNQVLESQEQLEGQFLNSAEIELEYQNVEYLEDNEDLGGDVIEPDEFEPYLDRIKAEKELKVESMTTINEDLKIEDECIEFSDDDNKTEHSQRYSKEQIRKCINTVISGENNLKNAAKKFGVSKQLLIYNLKKEYGDQYVKILSKFEEKSTKRKMNKPKKVSYTKLELEATMEDIKHGRVALHRAARDRGIPASTLARHLKKQLGDKFRETVFQWRQIRKRHKKEPVKEIPNDSNFKVVKFVKRQRMPSKEALLNAVNAVREGRMTVAGAYKIFNVPERFLYKIVNNGIDITNKNIEEVFDRRHNKSYPMEVLKHCTKLVREGKFTRKEAAYMFNLPISAIKYRLQRGFREDAIDKEIENHKINKNGVHIVEVDNSISHCRNEFFNREQRLKFENDVKSLLTFTNATPFLVLRGKVLCAYCARQIEDPEELREHVRELHTEERLTKIGDILRPAEEKELMRLDIANLQCNVCCIHMKSWNSMFVHLQVVHNLIIGEEERKRIIPFSLLMHKWNCVLCNERAGNYILLELHMNQHYDNYICHECGESFMTLMRLKKHKYNKRQMVKEVTCKLCKGTFVGRILYLEHLNSAHKVALRCPCKYCPERFHNRYPRHLHMLEKHREKVEDIVCKECGKVFQWKPFYVSHYKFAHLKERNHVCRFCDKAFFLKYQLTRHLARHTGEKDYVCEICSKAFNSLTYLKTHLKVHSTERDLGEKVLEESNSRVNKTINQCMHITTV